MKKAIILSLIVMLGSGASLAFAQSPYQSLYGSSGVPGLSKTSQADSLKLAIEMILLYKLLGQPSMVASDGGVIVLFGSKISKFDKDMNLVKEVDLNLDIDSLQELVSKVAGSYSKDLMNTMMGGLAGNLSSARMSSNGALAKATLRAISTAAESYQTANNGNYPTSVSDLMLATPPYLNTNYCDRELGGYYYSCDFKATGYQITATPSKTGDAGSKSYTITTGGVLKS